MRLRLSIRRNGLPETLITWAIDTTSSPTIYQLLEQVNEVVPIESDGEWGLEDYAVELKASSGVSYECLHFQNVASVMKEDDEVIKRSFSGRTQITADGKRLFDGVPWGRPLLRTIIDRPSIKIPPKKLSRLTYNSSAEGDEDSELLNQKKSSSKKVVIQSDGNFELDDSESDEDYIPENQVDDGSETDMDYLSEEITDEDRITTESKDLNKKQGKKDEHPDRVLAKNSLINSQHNLFEMDRSTDGFIGNFDFQAQIRLLHSAFPTSSLDVCKYVLTGTNGDLAEAWEAMSIGFPACKSLNMVKYLNTKKIGKPRDKQSVLENAVALYNSENIDILRSNPNNGMIKSSTGDNILEQFDKGGLPSGSIAFGEALSCMAKVAHRFKGLSRNHRSESNPSSHAKQFSSKDKLADSSKQVINTARKIKNVVLKSNGIDENNLHSNALDNKTDKDAISSSHSSATSVTESESISDSYSDTSDDIRCDSSDNQKPEESSSKITVETQRDLKGTLPKKSVSQPTVAPGQGKKATQLRNKRKRISNLMRRQKEKGILPVGISKEDFIAMYDKRNSSASNKQMSAESEWENSNSKSLNKADLDDEFQRRRKVLLDSLADGGVDISSELPKSDEKPSVKRKLSKTSESELAPHTQVTDFESELKSSKTKASDLLETDTEKNSAATELSKIHQPPIPQADQLQLKNINQKPTKSSQRSMLNLDAGRRMVFAAMGFKPPVTEQDKELIRKELMNNSDSSKNIREIHAETIDVVNETEGPETWRDKVIYRAKECVHADVELCEPPFPFVQRWDPQQITKKRKITPNSQTQNEESNESLAKRQKKNGEFDSGEENFQNLSNLSHKEIIQNDDNEHPDDLIPLPDDPSSLLNLQVEQIKIGMIIIFKQLEVSAATRWQPQISAYKTATVLSTVRGKIQVQLARRDFYTAEKLYNEQGERIYSGFDTIDIDETEDDGWRELHFNDLIEPKILEYAENNNVEASLTKTDSLSNDLAGVI
ncbi:putative clumping factor b protein [Erysiphe neolycopersici]|uniref:Putative clumping factor b protein n=1 Tax=Erysiphe neolycopersici TaxID=212602 RepID=A0A420HPX4_9PEZI|nr:putative clumping factor b protein [Erysiphe neolycopersici]